MSESRDTLLLDRRDVRRLLGVADCIDAVERGFMQQAAGALIAPAMLGVHVAGGGFHIKTAGYCEPPLFVTKVNANFPANPVRHGLRTVQGVVLLFDAAQGRPLAVMDSIEITSLRTAAATAVAARRLAREDAETAMVVGCGEQGGHQLRALATVRPIRRAFAYDTDAERARRFAAELSATLRIPVEPVPELRAAARGSDVVITCTTSRRWILGREDVRPGTFVAAVGADNPEKQELEPELMASATVVVDLVEQCAAIGDLHHAIEAGVMTRDDVHAELAEVVSGRRPGRTRADELTVFDSTGTAIQDVAAASLVYERALASGVGYRIDLGSE